MINDELKKWLDDLKKKNINSGQVYETLLKYKYPIETIKEAIAYYASAKNSQNSEKSEKKLKVGSPKIIAAAIIVLIAAMIVGLFAISLINKQTNNQISDDSLVAEKQSSNQLNDNSATNFETTEQNTQAQQQILAQNPEKNMMAQDDSTQNTSDCNYECFSEKFRTCQASKTQLSPSNNGRLDITIIGNSGQNCQLKILVVGSIEKDWIGKEMTCNLDGTKYFEDAIKEIKNCQGDLKSMIIMHPLETAKLLGR